MPATEREERYAGWRRAVAGVLAAARGVNLLFRDLPDARAGEAVERCCRGRVCGSSASSRSARRARRASGTTRRKAEWVLLLAGAARLRFADEPEARLLGPAIGSTSPPHRRHRVDWTDPATPTVWLAVFYR